MLVLLLEEEQQHHGSCWEYVSPLLKGFSPKLEETPLQHTVFDARSLLGDLARHTQCSESRVELLHLVVTVKAAE